MSYNESFKAQTAKSLTELAIQNSLITNYGSEEETALAICTFFKTIVDNLDDTEK